MSEPQWDYDKLLWEYEELKKKLSSLEQNPPTNCKTCGDSGIAREQHDGGEAELFCDCHSGKQKQQEYEEKHPDYKSPPATELAEDWPALMEATKVIKAQAVLLIAKDSEIEQLEAENRWIPIAEGLPKEYSGVYLVLPHDKHCPVLWWQDGEWYWYSHEDDAISESIGNYNEEPIFKPTHWKPIVLPKEGE